MVGSLEACDWLMRQEKLSDWLKYVEDGVLGMLLTYDIYPGSYAQKILNCCILPPTPIKTATMLRVHSSVVLSFETYKTVLGAKGLTPCRCKRSEIIRAAVRCKRCYSFWYARCEKSENVWCNRWSWCNR